MERPLQQCAGKHTSAALKVARHKVAFGHMVKNAAALFFVGKFVLRIAAD